MRLARPTLISFAAAVAAVAAVGCSAAGTSPDAAGTSPDAAAPSPDASEDDHDHASHDHGDEPADGDEVIGEPIDDVESAGGGYTTDQDVAADPDTEAGAAVDAKVYTETSEQLATAAPADDLAAAVELDPQAASVRVPDQDSIGYTGLEAFVVYTLSPDVSLVVTVGPDGQYIDDLEQRGEVYGDWEEVSVVGVTGAYRYGGSDILGLVMQIDGKDVQLNLAGGTSDMLPALADEIAAGLRG